MTRLVDSFLLAYEWGGRLVSNTYRQLVDLVLQLTAVLSFSVLLRGGGVEFFHPLHIAKKIMI